MKPIDESESSERVTAAALFTLLRAVDPDSLLPYTAVREVEAMAGERILAAVEAMRAETKAEFSQIRAEFSGTKSEFSQIRGELGGIRAELGEMKAVIASNTAAIVSNAPAIASNAAAIASNTAALQDLTVSQAEMKADLRALGGTYKQMLWVLIGILATALTSAVVALLVQVFTK